jgi:hypothetical protein
MITAVVVRSRHLASIRIALLEARLSISSVWENIERVTSTSGIG